MPKIYGVHSSWPAAQRPNANILLGIDEDLGLITDAQTLGDAIRAYEEAFNIKITPWDETREETDRLPPALLPFAFWQEGDKLFFGGDARVISEVLVERGRDVLGPVRDLEFALETDDIVNLYNVRVC